jgi:hypothetical protein
MITEEESDKPHADASEENHSGEEILQLRKDPLCRITELFNGRVNKTRDRQYRQIIGHGITVWIDRLPWS